MSIPVRYTTEKFQCIFRPCVGSKYHHLDSRQRQQASQPIKNIYPTLYGTTSFRQNSILGTYSIFGSLPLNLFPRITTGYFTAETIKVTDLPYFSAGIENLGLFRLFAHTCHRCSFCVSIVTLYPLHV